MVLLCELCVHEAILSTSFSGALRMTFLAQKTLFRGDVCF